MRLNVLAAPVLLALALAACSNGSDSGDPLSTDANLSDADINAALGGGAVDANNAADNNSAATTQ